MKFEELPIAGAWVITPELFVDERGVFRRHFCADEMSSRGIASSVTQGNLSENPHQHTLRGFHYQIPPHAEGKTISCFGGSLFDIVVDLRAESPTYLKWASYLLTSESRQSLHIPQGCANAYLTMEPNTTVHYYMSESYVPGSYRGFRYNDPAFQFNWPVKPRLISEKDATFPDLDLSNIDR